MQTLDETDKDNYDICFDKITFQSKTNSIRCIIVKKKSKKFIP